ncbi:hypothetical protein OAS39_01610 [Pirellulales bacterium]|nr:hypothetical protein [Pirellulales bacterium]
MAAPSGFDLRVGAATANLEADDSMVIAGFIGPVHSKGQEGQLRAVAIVVQGPRGNRVALVACDVLFTPRDIVDPALGEIEKTTGIPAANILVNATHTHHAPSTVRIHGCEREEKFCRRLQAAIVSAVQQADASAKDHRSQLLFHLGYVRERAPGIADTTIDIFRDMRKELQPLQGQQRKTVIQAVVIGDVAIVGVPAEYFTSLGVDIKGRSPFKHTYVAELANDWIGYLPDREGHRLGGYQTWIRLHCYAEVGTGERMADAVVEMLRKLASN